MSKPSRGDAIGIESVADQVSPGRAGHINRGTSQGFEIIPFGTTIAGSRNYESAPDTSSGASGGFEQAADPLVFQGYMQIGRPDADVGVAGRVPHLRQCPAAGQCRAWWIAARASVSGRRGADPGHIPVSVQQRLVPVPILGRLVLPVFRPDEGRPH